MFFLIQFFCATRYTLVVYGKNCLGDVATVFNPEKYFGDFSLEIIPKSASTYLESVSWYQPVQGPVFGTRLELFLQDVYENNVPPDPLWYGTSWEVLVELT